MKSLETLRESGVSIFARTISGDIHLANGADQVEMGGELLLTMWFLHTDFPVYFPQVSTYVIRHGLGNHLKTAGDCPPLRGRGRFEMVSYFVARRGAAACRAITLPAASN